jgi:hypothetical protein
MTSQVQLKLDLDPRKQNVRAALPGAQTAYLRGPEDWNLRTRAPLGMRSHSFNAPLPQTLTMRAVRGTCQALRLRTHLWCGNPVETMPQARQLSLHALQLDPGLAEEHSSIGLHSIPWSAGSLRRVTLHLSLHKSADQHGQILGIKLPSGNKVTG